jgi:hypothetical protein
MYKHFSFFLIPAAFIALAACTSPKIKKDLARVDSISVYIDSAEKVLNTVNIDSIRYKFKVYKEYAEKITTYYDNVKTDESWPYICLYRNCKKSFEFMVNGYPNYIAEIDSSRQQLESLRHDIRNELLEQEAINQYCMLEMQNAKTLIGEITFRVGNAINEEANFDTVHPKIVKFIHRAELKSLESGK